MEMDEVKREVRPQGSLVKEATLKQVKPCLAAEGKIRVLMELDSEIGDVIPLIANMYPPGVVNYVRKKNILTLTIYDRIISLYPSGKISMNKTHDVEEAFEIAGELMDRINRAHDSGGYGSDSRDMSRIGPMDVNRCLPGSNCGDCGESTCMAFAMKLLNGEQKLDSCLPLKEPWMQEKVQCLEKLLGEEMMETLGWSGY
ncbi:ArsR family metal-binding transcriptional regulator [Methanothermobacter defluvii]|uniref:ArsR family metal-binding transcriptional regulator n=1 Tax=Methanothermobacter defluvii TaxID=49339 RepID=A0A371NDJ6_9EURY|nr:(Fe-S)-binding protein [Methanothermobacter defluvii]REE28040.1 ArsR family metal-binding transcriptional regulator [Methanothermobacter defluvii]